MISRKELYDASDCGLPAGASGPLFGEAVAAVDGPVLSRQERNLGLSPTVGANGVVHRSGVAPTTPAIASATVAAPALAAVRTALGVLIATAGVELLIVSSECKLRVALDTGKCAILVSQLDDLLSDLPLRSGHRVTH